MEEQILLVESLNKKFEDISLKTHARNVSVITRILLYSLKRLNPKKYTFTEEQIYLIYLAAVLHDTGKAYISDEILTKPGKLTPEEKEIIKAHSLLGADTFDDYIYKPLFVYARDICACHHERFDGTGYPFGLKGNEIPIHAQVVGLADCYEALMSKRCYKDSISQEKVIDMLENGDCGKFNTDLIAALYLSADEIKNELAKPDVNEKFSDLLYNIVEAIKR